MSEIIRFVPKIVNEIVHGIVHEIVDVNVLEIFSKIVLAILSDDVKDYVNKVDRDYYYFGLGSRTRDVCS